MNARHLPFRLTNGAALLLGHASVLWGVGVALTYPIGFVMLAAQPVAGLGLPTEIPLIGLAMALSGVVVARLGGEDATRSPWFGLVLNALALTCAVALPYILG